MLKKMFVLAAVCTASLFAAEEALTKKESIHGWPGWDAGSETVQKWIAENVEPFKDTARNYDNVKRRATVLGLLNDASPSSFADVLRICEENKADEFEKVVPFAVAYCYCSGKFIKDAFNYLPKDHWYAFFFYKNRCDELELTADQVYEAMIGYIESKREPARSIDVLVKVLPNVTKKEADVLADLKRLNRKFSPYLLDEKKKDAYEPIVAKIRTMIATY